MEDSSQKTLKTFELSKNLSKIDTIEYSSYFDGEGYCYVESYEFKRSSSIELWEWIAWIVYTNDKVVLQNYLELQKQADGGAVAGNAEGNFIVRKESKDYFIDVYYEGGTTSYVILEEGFLRLLCPD